MKQNIKSSLIWAIILLAAMVMGFLISIAINRRADATLHTDYAENVYNRPLINWKVEYWLDTGDGVGDTVFVAVDTTTAGGEYTLELASNRYLISAFPLWGDATDSTGSRRQWVKEEVVVVAVLDTFSFPFVSADSGFIGDITGNITGAADSSVVAGEAWGPADDDWVVTDSIRAAHIKATSGFWGDLTGIASTATDPADDDWIVPDTSKAATLRATGNLAVGGDGGITGNLSVGDNAAITGDISCDDLTAADSVKGVNVVASTKLWAGAGDFGAAGVDITGHLNVDGLTDFDDEVDIGGGGLTMSAGGDIGAATTGSQITSFDYATILHIYAADSVKTNSQSGVMVSHTFETSGLQGSGFHGDLTGTASLWSGSGTVNDSLAALTTDIAALQATKVDTNKAFVHRDNFEVGQAYDMTYEIDWGSAAAPAFCPADTIEIDRVWFSWRNGSGSWQLIAKHSTGGTIAAGDTTSGSWTFGNDVDNTPDNATVTPAQGIWIDINEITEGTLRSHYVRVEFHYTNP